MSGLFLTTDLMFSSRVSGIADATGFDLTIVADGEQLVARSSEHAISLVLLDLSAPSVDPMELVPRLKQLVCPSAAVVAFGPHVHRARLDAAREAGCDEVMSRGEFNSQIESILARYSIAARKQPDSG